MLSNLHVSPQAAQDIVATFRGFHGRTMGALSTTWEPHYREPFSPLVPDVSHIRYNDLASADAAINEETAAVIIELVQGEGGVHVACEEYIHGLVSLCHERGALLIIDEVQTGFGRTGQTICMPALQSTAGYFVFGKIPGWWYSNGGYLFRPTCDGERAYNQRHTW